MLKKIFSVRKILSFFLLLSIAFASYSIYYKTEYWGFSFTPKKSTKIWTIEANIAFEPNGEPIKISLATPSTASEFKILEEDVVAPDYKEKRVKKNGTSRVILTSPAKEGLQNIYYRVLLYDNEDGKGKTVAPTPPKPEIPYMDEEKTAIANDLLKMSALQLGDTPQQIIRLLNQNPPDATVLTFLPIKKTQKDMIDAMRNLLAMKDIPTRVARGIQLKENKKSLTPDLMLEAYVNGRWRIYDIKTAKKGIPDNFVIFQRGGDSLVDVEGGENSVVKFSVLKSVTSSFKLASHRAKLSNQKSFFDYSIYNLPVNQQNTLKWFSIFPLAILVIVLMRNVIGVQTMGTFTPMLLALSLVKTGIIPGLICFAIIITIGLVIRFLLSKFNLLLVPRISAVVIFVILIMQALAIMGYQLKVDIGQSAVFFPIIIMAWIIERASITWEEDGAGNATREVFFSLLVAIITYFIVSNSYIRHIMFAFNELNLVILFVVMLLGTYTGYRLTELKRFTPLVKE